MDRAFIRMALAHDGPTPGYTPKYHPTYYLSDEAQRRREDTLVARIAREGLRPGESVPAYIMDRAKRELPEQKEQAA